MKLAHALIFDLDGTLVDSLDDIAAALNDALAAMKRPHAARDSVRSWVGDGLAMLCRRAWPDASSEEHARLIEAAQEAYRRACVVQTRPYGNILRMLDLIKARGIPMAVLSNKPHELTCRVIDELNMRSYFVAVCGNIIDAERKPSPGGALELVRKFGLPADSVGLVGDSTIDVHTSRNAGMISIACTWGFHDEGSLRAQSPDWVVHAPLDVLNVVRK